MVSASGADYIFGLYDIGYYPGAVYSSRASNLVRSDVYLLPDPEMVLVVLDKLEGCALDGTPEVSSAGKGRRYSWKMAEEYLPGSTSTIALHRV